MPEDGRFKLPPAGVHSNTRSSLGQYFAAIQPIFVGAHKTHVSCNPKFPTHGRAPGGKTGGAVGAHIPVLKRLSFAEDGVCGFRTSWTHVPGHRERLSPAGGMFHGIMNGLPLPLVSALCDTESLGASESESLHVSARMQQLRDNQGSLRGVPLLCPAPQAKRNEIWLRRILQRIS